MIEINDLSKRFGKKLVLDRLNITLEPNVYGLLGSNGSGKTTFIRCLTLLYKEGSTAIRYQGNKINNVSDYLMNVGYLPQGFALYRELTVKDMLLLIANYKGILKKEALAEIMRCLVLCNMDIHLNDRIRNLSGGMVRRLGIAQALIGDPSILIFDEPTAGLDPEERLRFKNLIEEVKQNKIIIISTHIVEDVDAICDRLIILANHVIAATGTNDEIRLLAQHKIYDIAAIEESSMKGKYSIYKKYEKSGQVRYRIMTNMKQDMESTAPEIEDGYLCVIKGV